MASSDDKGPKVKIVCWLVTALSAAFLALRLFCKFKTHRGLWWDDHVLIVSWVFLLITVSTTTAMVSLGVGKHLVDVDPANLPAIGLLSNVTGTFSILAAVLSKTSFAVTLLRITNGYTKMFVWFTIAIMNTSMWLSALFTWVKCNPVRKTWEPLTPGTCLDANAMTIYNVFAAAISAAADATLALLPWKIVWTLQMKWREKLGVALAMSMGIFAAGTAVVKCTKLPPLNGANVTYVAADIGIWGAVEIATTIMASCIPVLRVLLQYVKSSAKQYHSSHELADSSHLKGTRTHTATITSPGARGGGTRGVNDDDDSGSDKSILERSMGVAVANQIVQTKEVTVHFHEQEVTGKVNEDYDSFGGYETGSRGGD